MPIAPDGTPLPYPGEQQQAPADSQLPPTSELIRIALEALQAALVNEPDDVDSQALGQIVQGLYRILATHQKESEGLMGGGNMRALSRAYGG